MSRRWKITGISIASLITVIILLPELFPGLVHSKIKTWANHCLRGELNYDKVRLSFIKHFPVLSLTLYDFSLKGSEPFASDTLIAGKELSFGIDLLSIFKSHINVSRFYVEDARINIQVNEDGYPNYNVYKSDTSKASTTPSDSSTLSLGIEKIKINNSHLVYNDRSLPILIKAVGLDYTGKGDLTKSIFDLQSKLHIDSFDLAYGGEAYVEQKQLNADLLTKINTSSLSFIFEKNDLMINRLPVNFNGRLDFLSNGYGIDLRIQSDETTLDNLVTVLPPPYLTWQANTELKGNAKANAYLSGRFIADSNMSPDLFFGIEIKNGLVNHAKAPQPLSNLSLDFKVKLPSLSPDSLIVDLDTLSFNLGRDYVHAGFHSTGLNPLHLKSNIDASIDLAMFDRTLGLQNLEMKGISKLRFTANGSYATGIKPGWKKAAITSLPEFRLEAFVTDGFIKSPQVPYSLDKIHLNAKAGSAPNNDLSSVHLTLQPLSFELAGQPFLIEASVRDLNNLVYDVKSKGLLDLEKLSGLFPHEGIGMKGQIQTDLILRGTEKDAVAGRYDKLDNSGTLIMRSLAFTLDEYAYPFFVESGVLRFKQDKIWLDQFDTKYGSNQLSVKGYAANIFPYMMQKGQLKGQVNLYSDRIDLDEFKAADSVTVHKVKDTVITGSGVLIVPSNLDFEINTSVKNISFDSLAIKNFKGQLLLNNGKATLQETSFNLVDAIVRMNATYSNLTTKMAVFDFGIRADSFDIKKAYNEVPLFREMASSAANAEGIVSLDYKLAGKLDENMEPIYPSLKGGGTLSLAHVKVNGLKLFSAVSKAAGKDSLNNPDLKKVVIKTTIANNIITLERTKMKVFGFRPRIEGQTSFDGDLNLKFRLGLPPFGLFGIPMTVTGTTSQPKVKLKRSKEGDIIQEKLDDTEVETEEE